ncbi:hypothetical protein BH20ACT4_BH20ACT4_09290 [soil metagenome]
MLDGRAGVEAGAKGADMTELVPYWNFVFDSARWAGFSFRPDDVVICTPPKSGTTWMQMLCAMLLFDAVEFDRPLPDISP